MDDAQAQILFIDDDEISREIVSNVLADTYQLTSCKNANDALSLLKKGYKPDLILSDIFMPEIDGIDFIKALKEEYSYHDIPVIFITSSQDEDIEIKALLSGANDLVTKPFSNTILKLRIERLLQLAQSKEKLAIEAKLDGLTNLDNRRAFDEMLAQEFGRFQRNHDYDFSLLVIDLDDFKHINDNYGHSLGDSLLVQVGRLLLKNCARSTDRAFRIGGDEFAIILPASDLAGALTIAEHIIADIGLFPVKDYNHIIHARLSIGVSSAVTAGIQNTGMLFDAADKALYQAKLNKPNKIVTG